MTNKRRPKWVRAATKDTEPSTLSEVVSAVVVITTVATMCLCLMMGG